MEKNINNKAIGVFDSGLGGLTVVKELMRQLPREDIVYFGDTARVPYGTKSRESIIRFSKENANILLQHKVKMIVIACNSSSSHAIPSLKNSFNVPIIGVIDAGARKAVKVTKNKTIGVVATTATINSQAYTNNIKKIDKSIRVISQPCPLFVPLVEEGWFKRKVTEEIAREYLSKIKKSKADALILGCTHYPLLKTVFRKVMGPKVILIDSAHEIALEVKEVLHDMMLLKKAKSNPKYQFLVSDEASHFSELAKRFLGCEILKVKRVMTK